MLMIALIVACLRDGAVERRSEWSASTVPAMASNTPTREAGYSAPPSGATSASSPRTSVTTASAGSRVRGLTSAVWREGITEDTAGQNVTSAAIRCVMGGDQLFKSAVADGTEGAP